MTSNGQSDVQVYKRLLTYTHWGAFGLSILGFMLYSLANVSVLQLISYLVDSLQGTVEVTSDFARAFADVFGEGDALNQTLIPVAIVLIVLARGLGTFIGNYFISYTSTRMVHQLRCELFEQILHLPSRFYDRNALGHLVAKVTYHVTQVTGAATEAVKVIIREGFTVLGYLGFLLYLNWKLTLLFFAVAPVIALLVGYAGKRFRRISERIQDSMGDVTHVASEAVQGYRVVRTFGGTSFERERFLKVSQDNRRQSMKMVVTSAIATPVVQLIVSFALAGLVWLVLDPSIRGGMSTGDIVAFITTGGLLAKPIRQLSEVNATVQKGLAAAQDIFSLFDAAVEPDTGQVEKEVVSGKIEFRNVSFQYGDGEPQVLSDVSFIVNPGETIALVGRSGSGKSTMASLVPRFYSPTAGQILLDDTPIGDFKLANLRQHISLVTQQVTLFNDTVRRNIAYGDLNGASDAEVIEAAKKAYAWEFIQTLENGLDTVVGDDGVLLSGGQRQRIAIARAFIKDSPILILDEATSALDSESERYIQKALDAVVKGRTTIVIAHRLSTIEKADRILVVEQGRIVEQGSHSELMSSNGAYAAFQREGAVTTEPDESAPADTPAAPKRRALLAQGSNILTRAWYNEVTQWPKLLTPVSALFTQVAKFRRHRQENHPGRWQPPVPVVVVGNITVGGTGKTPLVISLVEQLMARGLKPGVVMRGYGGDASGYPARVSGSDDPAMFGDEAVMIARRTGAPVVVDPDRVRAGKHLTETSDCDLVISDDGLQHYKLHRDLEIAVVDGNRGLGNRLCLPAGPLREPPARLKEVDFVIVNGKLMTRLPVAHHEMKVFGSRVVNLHSGDPAEINGLVHAVMGIGNPERFLDELATMGLQVIEHIYPDHHAFTIADLVFDDEVPVIMTEKDAVKCRSLGLEAIHQQYWYLEAEVELPASLVTSIVRKLGLNVTPLKPVPNEAVKV